MTYMEKILVRWQKQGVLHTLSVAGKLLHPIEELCVRGKVIGLQTGHQSVIKITVTD